MGRLVQSRTYLWSFGKLLRKMRGRTALEVIAGQAEVDVGYLDDVETGRRPVDVLMGRHILLRAFALNKQDVNRLVLGIQLYDLGLHDNDFRRLMIDVVLKTLPVRVQEQIRRLYLASVGKKPYVGRDH